MAGPELLAPAGDLSKLRYALAYGADAVYLGGPVGGLRAAAGNFTVSEIRQALELCRERGRKLYLTVNYYPHAEDIPLLADFLCALDAADAVPDAFIVSDPGVLRRIYAQFPEAGFGKSGPAIHISTQASVTNADAALFWYEQGARRIILARELSLAEIREIRERVPADLELEAFIHGAVCMAYSGRCVLSNMLTGRDGNRGDCAQSCRWRYALVEEKRPGEYLPVEQDGYGTYILSSKDLNMLGRVADLTDAGVTTFKIEGRMKSEYYVATVTRAYRHVIDGDPDLDFWEAELEKASHRDFFTGFFDGNPGIDGQDNAGLGYIRGYTYVGMVTGYLPAERLAAFEQRGKFSIGEPVEVFGPTREYLRFTVEALYDEEMNPVESVPHAQQKAYLKLPEGATPPAPYSLIRKR
ncbi:MAG: U32 family peptidase [Clostridiales Family XIII bacterium]|jgi:putative protease|nr:U32 family peptidase [Clostridiales Family XIII bacterium]